jgi:unsaturated rhamnogalacturonyl hydrolase
MRQLGCILTILLAASVTAAAAEHRDIGLTMKGTRIEANIVEGASSSSPTVMLLGGLGGEDESSRLVNDEARKYEAQPQNRRTFRLIAIAVANPEKNRLAFPPTGVAYRENSESHVLWRWIGIQAPDLVLAAGEDFGLTAALSQSTVAGVGKIPARHVDAKAGLLDSLPKTIDSSEAHQEVTRRLGRSPQQLADELATVYGHDFDQLTYLPGMALIGQMRLGHVSDVEKLAARYLDGRDNLARASSLTLAGHMVFAELAERTKDPRYTDLVRKAANTGFNADGSMKESMPYHDEMSDSVFMALPILAKAGKLTGDPKYFDMAARHLAFMQKLVLRPDGLYRHSPLTDAAWGRGNAFPALGLTLTLTDFPKDHPGYSSFLQSYQKLMAKLAQFQTQDGLWREVIDQPGAYEEFSATAMIATSMLRGIRNGWIDAPTYQPYVDKAWRAILRRVGANGLLFNVCESTNKQNSLDDYLHRAAILDRDPRGGGMAMIFATEMAGLK